MMVGLDRALKKLQVAVRDATGVANELRVNVAEDHPLTDEVHLVRQLDDRVTELIGRLREAAAALVPVTPGEKISPALDGVGRALLDCQSALDTATADYWNTIHTYDMYVEIERLARLRRGEWRAWAGTVNDAIERCEPALANATHKLHACWAAVVDGIIAAGLGAAQQDLRSVTTKGISDAAT